MPDGGVDEDFPHVVKTVDSLIALRASAIDRRRHRARSVALSPGPRVKRTARSPHVGGSPHFAALSATRSCRPSTATGQPRRSIVGRLAGLFIVETFLLERRSSHYVARPGLWWNSGALDSPARLRRSPPDPVRSSWGSNVPDITRARSARRSWRSRAKLTWEYAPHPELTQDIFLGVGPTALARALRWTRHAWATTMELKLCSFLPAAERCVQATCFPRAWPYPTAASLHEAPELSFSDHLHLVSLGGQATDLDQLQTSFRAGNLQRVRPAAHQHVGCQARL
jgi:hypothetical protein